MVNNNSSTNEDWLKSHRTIHDAVLAGAILVSVPVTLFNLFSIFILVFSRRMRKARNFPIVSFLAASAMQSLFVLPIYMQKTLDDDPTNQHEWICDLYRFPYFFTQHFIKVGLLVSSIDRIIAIRCPYRYSTMVSKFMMLVTLTILFVFTLFIDLIPFFVNFGKKKENCAYLPTQEWGLSVIIMFDMLPFIVIVANYIAIWRIAASISRSIRTQKRVTGMVDNEGSILHKYSLRNHHANSFSENNETNSNSNTRELDVVSLSITASEAICKQMSFARRRQSSEMSEDQLHQDTNSDTNIIPYNDVNCSTSSINSSNSSKSNNNNPKKTPSNRSRNNGISFKFAWEMKATRTSIIGGVVYAVCWMPMGFFYIVDHMCDGCLSGERTNTMRIVKISIKYICLTSSIFLPFVFCWRTKEFRHEVVRMFCKKWHQKNALKSAGLSTSGALSGSNNAAIITNRNAKL